MKLQTAKAGLWFITLTISGTTVAAAQISATQSPSPLIGYAGKRDALSVLSSSKPSASESIAESAAESSLPDAPSVIAERQAAQEPSPAPQPTVQSPRSAVTTSFGPRFVIANGALLGSSIANAAEIGNCRPSACQAVPAAIRSRGDLYAIAIPASLGVTYISYRLKRSGTRLWIVPVALFTAGNIIYAVHASRFSNP
jgi:hypothetical protein